VHEPRNILHGLSLAKGERVAAVWWAAGCLGVNAQNARWAISQGPISPRPSPVLADTASAG
jgi:hypothetical protein